MCSYPTAGGACRPAGFFPELARSWAQPRRPLLPYTDPPLQYVSVRVPRESALFPRHSIWLLRECLGTKCHCSPATWCMALPCSSLLT